MVFTVCGRCILMTLLHFPNWFYQRFHANNRLRNKEMLNTHPIQNQVINPPNESGIITTQCLLLTTTIQEDTLDFIKRYWYQAGIFWTFSEMETIFNSSFPSILMGKLVFASLETPSKRFSDSYNIMIYPISTCLSWSYICYIFSYSILYYSFFVASIKIQS